MSEFLIPLIKNEDLSTKERYFLMYLLECNIRGKNPDLLQIQIETGISRTSISQYITSLKKKGYLYVRKRSRFNYYTVVRGKLQTKVS
jgi:DNA-binding MarR family transcriptional regulator